MFLDFDSVFLVTILGASWNSWLAMKICSKSGNLTNDYEHLIVSRKRSMTSEEAKKAMEVFTLIGVDVTSFKKKKQGKNCKN